MAKYGKTLAEVLVQINGTSQTKKVLEALTQTSKELGDKIKVARAELEKLAESGGGPAYDAKKKELAAMVKEQTQLNRAVNETKKFSQSVGDILNDMSNNNVSVLNRTKRTLEALLNSITPNTKKAQNQIEQLQKAIQRVTDEIARRKGQLVDLDKVMANLGKATPKQLDAVEKRLQTLLESVTKNSNAWRMYDKQMRLLQEERSRRTTAQAQDIMGGNYTKTIEGTKQAIEFLRKYQSTLNATDTTAINAVTASIKKMNAELEAAASEKAAKVMQNPFRFSPEEIGEAIKYTEKLQASVNDLDAYHKLQLQIERAKKALDEFAENSKHEMMVSQFGQLEKLSVNALAEQKKYWEAMRDSGKYYDEAIAKLKEMQELETTRMKESSTKTLTTDLLTAGTGDIKQSVEWLTKYQASLEPLGDEWTNINNLIKAGEEHLKSITETVSKQNLSEQAGKIMGGDYTKTIEGTKQAIEVLKKYQDTLDTTNPDAINEVTKSINKMKEELESASRAKAEEVMANPMNFSADEINEAIKLTEKLQAATNNATVWENYEQQLIKAREARDRFADDSKYKAMVRQFEDLEDLTANAWAEQKKYWEAMRDSGKYYDEAIAKLKEMQELETTRMKESSTKTLTTDLLTAGTGDIKQSVEWLTKYQASLEPLGDEWTNINNLIKAGEVRLKSITETVSKQNLSEQAGKIMGGDYTKTIEGTKQAIEILKKYQQTLDATDTKGINKVEESIKRMSAELDKAQKASARKTLTADLNIAGTADIKQAVDWLTKYQGTLKPLSPLWKMINKEIEAGNNRLKELSDSTKMTAMTEQFKKYKDLSVNALAEQKKYWAEVKNTYTETDSEYKKAVARLEKIDELEKSRTKAEATPIITEATSGTWDKTIEETEKAIKLIQDYKKQLHTSTDAAAIADANKAIEALNANLGKAKEGLMDYGDALKIADEVQKGTFDGTSEEIEKAKKALEAYRKTLKQKTDADSIRDVDKALQNLTRTAGEAGKKLADVDYVLDHLDSSSMEELQSAAKQLQEQLSNATRGTEAYAKQAEKLREVNAELKKAKKEWEGQENVIAKTAKRLAAYVAVYGGFNAIIDKMKEVVGLNLQLSDSMADVQKTTGLTGVELQELGRELAAIDTRTATTELYQLAAAAGQIGLKTQEDVLGFAKAANIISVALNELGAEGSATITKIATLTGDVAKSGTEQALLKVGSAINELTANSAAAAGPIADFISRVGGIASASDIAIHEMAALGAATDASAQSIEIAGTSMNKFISALVSNTENIAYATNLNAKELQDLISNGNTMQAVIRVLESMQNMDRSGIAGAMKELGSEGARMNQYIASMVSNLDMLKRQLVISKEAFEENVSVVNEYNVKQESAMGILQRMKNAFLDTFVNSKMTVVLRDVLEWIAAIPRELEKWPALLLTIKIIISQILLFKLPFLLHKLMIQLSGMYALLAGPTISAVKAFRHAWRQAELELVFAGKSVNTLSVSLKTLGNIIKTHPIMFIASIITAGAVAWMHFKNKTDEVSEAMQELNEKHTRQIEELDALRAALDSINASYATRAAAMREINSLYSKYLGFELSELDAYEKKSKALDYINAKLKENQAIEQENRQREVYTEQFTTESKDEMKEIRKVFESIPEITAARIPEAIEVMNNAIKEGASTYGEVIQKLSEYFNSDKIPHYSAFFDNKDEFSEYIRLYSEFQTNLSNVDKGFANLRTSLQNKSNQELWELNAEQQRRIASLKAQGDKEQEAEQIAHLQNLLKEEKEYLETSKRLQEAAKNQDYTTIRNNTNTDKTLNVEGIGSAFGPDAAKLAEDMNKQIEQLKDLREKAKNTAIEATKAELAYKTELQKENNEEQIRIAKAEYDKLAKERDDYNMEITNIDMKWQDNMRTLQTEYSSDVRKQWTTLVDEVEKAISTLQVKIAGDPWGKAFNLKDWKDFPKLIEGLEGASVVSLVEGFKKLRDNTKLITKDVESFNKMFQLETPLKSLDEVNTQVFDWANQIRQELKKRNRGVTGEMLWGNPKEEMDFVLNQIKTYFLKRQAQIRKSYIDGMVTSEEMKRRLDENNNALLDAQIQFQKMMLGQESSFTEMFIPGIESHDLTKLRTEIRILGDEVTDEIEKSLAENENTVVEGAQKIKEALEKELRTGDPFGTLRESLRSSLDSLKLMSSEYEREIINDLRIKFPELTDEELGGLTEEKMQERIGFLMELAQSSYTVDRDGLRKMFDSHQEYYAWVDKLDDKQMDVMLAKLQWFYDESLIKQKAYADRLIKAQESAYEQQGLKYDDVAKLQWERQNLINKRAALQSQNTLVSDNPIIDPKEKSRIESEIAGHTQAINRLDEQILEAQKKAAEKNKSFRSKQEREAKEQMEASISALQAYYNEMEALIRKQGLENKWTPEDIERKVMANKIAAEHDEIELRKKLLGDASTFDPNANNGYKGVITGHEFFGANKGEKELKKQADQIKIWGKALIDGMRNQIAKGEIEIATEAEKVREKVKKALLEGDMFGKFENDFSDMLDEIGVLTSEFEDKMNEWHTTVKNSGGPDFGISLSEDERKSRIAALVQFADEAYSLTADSLRERMAQNTIYANWVNNLNDDEMGILLQKLRGYYDDRLELTKKYQDQMKKEFDAYYQQTGKQAEYEQKKNDNELRNKQRGDLEGFGVTRGVDYGAKRQSISDSFDIENQKYIDQIAKYKEQSEALTRDMVKVYQENGLGSPEYQEMYRQKEAMDQLIFDTELERNQLLAQSQRDLTQIYMDEWTKRAERWGQWGEMFGEYLGEQVMLEKQANDARARGDLETAKKIEQQQKQNKQALIQNLLSKIVDEAALWAKEYALKMMFNSLILSEDKRKAVEEATLQGKSSMLSILLNALTGQSKEHSKGLPGLVTGAIIFAATMALQAMAKSAIANMFPEADTGSTGTRKLSTGMLTYAEGNYPVLGNDGKVYDAKYEGAGMKTGIYGGGAHFGIFSEKQPEMIVDGKTTQKLILNYPYIYDAITTIAKNGRLVNVMPTFATGDYPAGMKQIAPIAAVDASAGNNEQMERTNAVLEQATSVIRELNKVLTSGQISANVDPYANRKATQRAEKFMKRRGID